MEIGSLLILLGLLLLVCMGVLKPFFDPTIQIEPSSVRSQMPVKPQDSKADLIAQQEKIFQARLYCEEDFHQGKIPLEGYNHARQMLQQEGAVILHALEKLENATTTEMEDNQYGIFVQEDPQIEEMINEHRKKNQERMSGFCPKCGKPTQKSDHFCSRCGYKI
jgi:hypothetical protein